MDNSVGNDIVFLVIWQISGFFEIVLVDFSGRKYYIDDFVINLILQIVCFRILGIVKVGVVS